MGTVNPTDVLDEDQSRSVIIVSTPHLVTLSQCHPVTVPRGWAAHNNARPIVLAGERSECKVSCEVFYVMVCHPALVP
jgi:hypothetical protein